MVNKNIDYTRRIEAKRRQNPFISQTELVYDILLEDILLQNRKPGSRIIQDELVELLGVSRSPIRDAIGHLVGDGFLVKRSRNGYYTAILTIKQVLGLIEFRTAIEVEAGRLAVRKSTKEDLAFLRQNIEEMAAYGVQDWGAILDLDAQFHLRLVQCAKNEYLVGAYQLYTNHFRLLRNSSMNSNSQENIVVRHRNILYALEIKNADLLEKAIREHLQNILDDVGEVLRYSYDSE